jgi:hypothetical protein
MTKRSTLVPCGMVVATACVLTSSCSKSSSPGSTSTGNDPTPPGTAPVTSAPYPVCTTLEPGSFSTSGSYAVPATTSCTPAGAPTPGAGDAHCVGVTPQTVNGASCSIDDAGSTPSDDAGLTTSDDAAEGGAVNVEAGAPPTPGPCDENGTDGAYGSTLYGTEGDDDDCKYHVSYTASPICENNGTYFVVTANYLTRDSAPLTGASTFAELCLSNTHPAPAIDARPPSGDQQVVEGPPGTYTVGPLQFDAPGIWTVRFHFNEFCCDVADNSPHGHAAFHVTVP